MMETVYNKNGASLRCWPPTSLLFALAASILVLLLSGCSEEPEQQKEEADTVSSFAGCLSCHNLDLDKHHRLDCTSCHGGNGEALGLEEAHLGLVAAPAHPDQADQVCGSCHREQVEMVAANGHYTLIGHISAVRAAFGSPSSPESALQITAAAQPGSETELVDDLLRRRCLRCHVYTRGDTFPAIDRGLGCAACHLAPHQAEAGRHLFRGHPADDACLSCHYGNHVGFDYYGRYEHDFNREYRTPYLAVDDVVAPYGVEFHQLEADAHRQAGMVCIDCHGQDQVMGVAAGPTCSACHDRKRKETLPPAGITDTADGPVFISAATTRSFPVPQLRHPAHAAYRDTAVCLACHARWTFNDGTTHLVRIDHDDFYDFFRLSVDGSSEVKTIIESHIDFDGAWLDPVMTDKFTGEDLPGVWLKGYLERRWEEPLFARDDDGRISPARPILDLRLSWIDGNETVRFDNLRPRPDSHLLRPYAPHTVGPAGLFYEERLRRFQIRELSLPAE
ncbi:hypothetical protein [Desulfofustis glycolicus]|nr:hypothetical protein [Desulfofustis glycolicus]MCB2214836.1 hypothetical protein [Desulfobulbaceae bacterium]